MLNLKEFSGSNKKRFKPFGSSSTILDLLKTKNFHFFLTFVLIQSLAPHTLLVSGSANGFIEGVGYREQELQLPKGSLFSSETPTGIPWASFSGGTTIFIKGQGFEDNAQSNKIFFRSYDLNQDIQSFPLSENDAFGSNPANGKLTYRLPSVHELLGVPEEALSSFDQMTFLVYVKISDDAIDEGRIWCSVRQNCMITFKRMYSPVIYGLSPPVMYFQSLVELWFDPKSVPSLIQDLPADSLPFINIKVNDRLIDFEEYVSSESKFNQYYRNAVRGRVGDNPVGLSNKLSMLWEVGLSKLLVPQATHCSYDNKTCFISRTVPVIYNVSSNLGFTTGGQILSISGSGFEFGQINTTVDGVDCKVIERTSQKLRCVVDKPQGVSVVDTPTVGSHGIRRTLVNGTLNDRVEWWNLFDRNATKHPSWEITDSVSLQLEGPYQIGDYYANIFKGWFVPPATARYRFYISCDDDCLLLFNNQSGNATGPSQLLKVTDPGKFRDYWRSADGNVRISEWQSLEEAQNYYIEVQHLEWSGNDDHISVAVEIEQATNSGHHHMMKEVQHLAIQIENNLDTFRLNISNIDDGEFILNFRHPVTMAYTKSNPIKSKVVNYWDIVNALWPYYGQVLGTDIIATVQHFDLDGNLTTNVSAAVSKSIIVQAKKLLQQVSSTTIIVSKTSTSSTITVEKPMDLQISSPPLSGRFKVKCPSMNNQPDQMTTSIPFDANAEYLQLLIGKGCYDYLDKFQIFETSEWQYKQNGRGWYIRFVGINGDVPQFELIPDETSPLTGNNVTLVSETIVPFSQNIFYEPIPYEFLRTFETKPQILVSVDGEPAVCHNLNCDFQFVEPQGEVTSFTFDESTLTLEMIGYGFPQKSQIQSIEFAQSKCTPTSISSTKVICSLEQQPTCGNYLPVFTSTLGKIPDSSSISPVSILCSVTGVIPEIPLNLLGGDLLRIQGDNFPIDQQSNSISIKFSDSLRTQCVPLWSTTSQIACLTRPFSANDAGQAVSVTVLINDQSVTNSLSFSLRPQIKSALTMSPQSASPVLKTKIKINLSSDFPYTMARGDFSVNASSQTNSSYFRQMNVIAVDDSEKSLTVMFGGAYSGNYDIAIRHSDYGLLSTAGLVLNVGSTVTSISPLSGSIFGGTVLTITGTNFGTQITDNPVQISYNGGVGSTDCFLISTSSTEIKCRIDPGVNMTSGKSGEVVVFLKTSEEASCIAQDCKFTFSSVIPTINSLITEFDQTLQAWTIIASGHSLVGDTSSVTLEVGGVLQQTVTVQSSQAVFKLTNLTSAQLEDVKIYFPVGVPKFEVNTTGLSIEPRLISVKPNTGSIGSSVIVARVEGVGTSSTGLNLVDTSGVSICKTAKVVNYGDLECHTFEKEISKVTLQVKYGSTFSSCYNSDQSECQYQQLSSESIPSITLITLSSDASTLAISGSNFDTSIYSVQVEVAGVKADLVSVDSVTQITASWSKGIPPLVQPTTPIVKFTLLGSNKAHYASGASSISNPLQISASTSGLLCSFAGGCKYEINSPGLASLLQQSDQNKVQVCGSDCNLDISESSASKAVCRLPQLSTIYSNSNFNISTLNVLKSGKYFGSGSNPELAFDGSWINTYQDTSANCYVGTEFKQGFVGILSRVKYFLPAGPKINIPGNLVFQGSNDGITYNTIFTADQLAHEGWNQVDFGESKGIASPKFRFYRMKGLKSGVCSINEIELFGVESIDDNNSQYECIPSLTIGGAVQSVSLQKVTYQGSKTALLQRIEPRYGSVTGGEEISFYGQGFSSNSGDIKIIIDGINCPVSSASSTQIKCITGKRPGLKNSTLSINIEGQGAVSLQDKLFKYVSYWSSDTTWGGEYAPMEGESIYVPPGLNLLVDVDKTPEINAVIVEGSLIFAPHPDPSHQRFFDAHYIFVNGGTMEVGTEDYPYTSKLTITMHGTISDPYLPTYGNKCIGIRHGNLSLIGQKRDPTWTVLEKTAEIGSNQITLRRAVDWQVGEHIAVAATGYDAREAEEREIVAIDRSNPDKPVLTLDKPFEFRHFADTENYGEVEIDMRAEVGLLSRNIVFRGDESSVEGQYGAIIFLHSFGDDSLVANIAYTEFTRTGQAFKQGRYTVHFHMIGAVHQSYAKGNSVHQSFNRAFTIHGTEYLRLEENVVFDSMGHSIFMEDAVERHNFIYKNLVIMTKRSWSLLNTDQTPASFWITNPNNHFIENHAAGSDRYSYWYDLKSHAIGPSASNEICPEFEELGMFANNHAHSNGRYGLRIFHNMIPRTYPCLPLTYDNDRPEDPHWQNPLIPGNFYNLTSWKNGRTGAIAERVGNIKFIGFKTADNILSGLEFSLTEDISDGLAMIINATIVGMSRGNNESMLALSDPHGIIAPRTENFTVSGVDFYNFNWKNASALGSCSHCFHPAATDSGARTTIFNKLTFTNVTNKIRYGEPQNAIFYDEDGSLTGKGPKSWATFYYANLNVPECEHKDIEYDGVVCDSNTQIRRIAFWDWLPNGLFQGQPFYILPIDDELLDPMTPEERTAYFKNITNYGHIQFKEKLKPMNAWIPAIATGHKYKIHWGGWGLDFEKMTLDLSNRWKETDKSIVFVHNFTDVRAFMNVTVNGGMLQNSSLLSTNPSNPDHQIGQFVLYNDTQTREFQFVVNGFNKSKNLVNNTIILTPSRCVGSCLTGLQSVATEDKVRLWSDPKSWTSGKVPIEGESVDIEPGWNMEFDLENSPVFKFIRVNGRLSFKRGMDLQLNAKHIFVRAGELLIGNETHPFLNKAVIKLYGEKNFEQMVYDNAIEAGNKLIANVGTVKMYGKRRVRNMVRLLAPVFTNDTQILVEPGLDLEQGDHLALLPTSYIYNQTDQAFVESYDSESGIVTLQSPITQYHWGAPESTAQKYNGVDIRGEVLILTRNVRIIGEDIEGWGGQIVTSDTIEGDLTMRNGTLMLDSVEIYNCSQAQTMKSALRFEGAINSYSVVQNTAIHNGLGWGVQIKESSNIIFQNNTVFNFRPLGINLQFATNISIYSNIVGGIHEREIEEKLGMLIDKMAGMCICSYFWEKGDKCVDVRVRHNIVGGALYAGYVVYGHRCGDYKSQLFYNNTAHSIDGFLSGLGAWIFPNPWDFKQMEECYEGSYFNAYKTKMSGVYSFQKAGKKVVYTQMTMIDQGYGMGIQINTPGPQFKYQGVDPSEFQDYVIELNDNQIFGDSEIPDCPHNISEGNYCNMMEKFGAMPGCGSTHTKVPHITMPPQLPPHKIKMENTWGAIVRWNRNKFANFPRRTQSGMKNTIFGSSHYHMDYEPIQEIYDSVFDNVDFEAIANLMDPLPEWSVIDDCGNFPCSGPKNVMLQFKNSRWINNKPFQATSDFQIIAHNEEFSPYVPKCSFVKEWNANFCTNDDLGILLFESQEDRRFHRALQPVYVKKQGTGMNNTLNAFMDHVWDGFYTGQTRLPRFPSVVFTPRGSIYDIVFSGNPPKKLLFELKHLKVSTGMTVRIAFPDAISTIVSVNNEAIEMNQWDKSINQYGEIKQRFCGENRYIGVKNILEFYLTSNCKLYVSPRDVIQSQVRMEWSLKDFYSSGGTTTLADRICGALGIHASQLKIVSVYEGSLVVSYDISAPDDGSTSLDSIEKQQTQLFATGQMSLGAPILDVQVKRLSSSTSDSSTSSSSQSQSIVKDGVVTAQGYEPVKITVTQSNINSNIQTKFNPNITISQESVNFQNQQTVTQTLINKEAPKIVQVVEVNDEGNGMMILGITIGVAILVILLVIIRFIWLRQKREQLEKELRFKQAQEIQLKVHGMRVLENDVKLSDLSSKKLACSEQDVQEEPQYDPSMDFQIFSRYMSVPDRPIKQQDSDGLNHANTNDSTEKGMLHGVSSEISPSEGNGSGELKDENDLDENKEIHDEE